MKFVPNSVSRIAGRTALRLNASSPTILVVTGVVGFGVTAVMAARATHKAEPVLDDHAKQRLTIAETAMTKDQEQKSIVSLYLNTSVELGKVYGPTVIVGTISAASILYGHNLLKGRHVATMLAYSGLQDQFLAYRNRVAKTLGEAAERDIYDGARGEWVEDPDHKGEYRLAPTFDEADADLYLRPWFDERNDNCRNDPQGNYLWLKGVQTHMQSLLEIRGYLFLNEVRRALGWDDIPEGQVAGWLYNADGDNFVDLGFMTGQDPHSIAFREHTVNTVRLNFNIDGLIYDRINDYKRSNRR